MKIHEVRSQFPPLVSQIRDTTRATYMQITCDH